MKVKKGEKLRCVLTIEFSVIDEEEITLDEWKKQLKSMYGEELVKITLEKLE